MTHDEVSPERVRDMAASVGISLDVASAARVASAVNPNVKRFSAENIALPLEIEPATFAVVAHQMVKW
ncbi:MAG TPA: hypothetical protein VKW08_10935 [Xanthobacteraceae bacterium]|nr:hypothetical protein [Xanthobacteraceae bacterium]